MASQNALQRLYDSKYSYIENSLSRFDKDLRRLQELLFKYLAQEYIPQLQVVDGVIPMNTHNSNVLIELDKYLNEFKKATSLETFAKLGNNMLKTMDLTTDYYKKLVGANKTVERIARQLDGMRNYIGIDKKGVVIEGSFIDKLATGDNLKTALSQYVQRNLTGATDMKSFVKGFSDLIQGSDEVNGAYEKYVGGYARDIYFQQTRATDNFFAEQLGLEYFVYDGDIVKDSRPFCIKHHGKTYKKEILAKWDEQEWQGKIPDVPVIQQVGGYRCRHILRWIPSEYGEENMANES